jgi:hypothetical protein
MNPTSKKLISLVLVFSLMAISCASFRTIGGKREKHGAKLVIQRKSDQVEKTRLEGTPWETPVIAGIRGELIAVKPNSLLLSDTEGKNVSIDIADIKVIAIVKKSKARLGRYIGGAVGFVGGMVIAMISVRPEEDVSIFFPGLILGWLLSIPSSIIGGMVGSPADKIIQIEGMTDLEINEALDELRKKARIRDYR